MPDKKYLIEIPDMPDSSGIWDSDKWERNKDKFMEKYPTANVFELGQYDENDTDENDQLMLTFDNDADSSGVWDSAKWERNKEAFVAKYPEAHVNRVRYVDYWGNKAKSDRARMEELQQPDEARNAKLAEMGYYDDITGGQIGFDLDAPSMIGLMPLSSAIKQNSVSGETTYLDPKVEEFFANDTAHTERQMEMNRLREEYDRNPRVVEQREYEAQMARYAADLEKQIKSDMEPEVDMVKAARGASAKHQFGTDMTSDQMGYLLDRIAGDKAGSGAEENEKLERYNSALKLLQQAKDAREVAGKGLGGGIADTAKDWVRNAATQSDIEMYNEIGNILTSLESKVGNLNEVSEEDIENNLSNDEKALIRAFFEYNAAMADAGENMSTWYKGGKIFAESIPFMLEFLVTGGLATGAGRAATSWMGKGFAKWIAKSAKGTLARAVKKGVAKSVSGVAKTMVAAGARTLVAPSTSKNIAEQSVQYGEDGHLDRGGNMVKAAVDSYIEQLSEMSGAAFGEVLGGIGKLALGKTAFNKIGAWFGNNATMQTLSRLGFHGLPEEVGEEIFGNALRTITGVDDEALSRMFEKDEFASMIIGFAPMTLIGAGTSAAQMGAVSIGAANAGRRMRQDLSRSYTEEQIDQVVMSLDAAKDANQITEAIKPIITGMAAAGAPKHEIQSVWDYAIAVAKKKAMISAQSVQEMQLTEAKIGEVRDAMGERFWIENEDGTRDVKQITLNNGNTAYVVSKPDQDGRVAIINADTGQKGTALPEDIKEESWNGTLNAFGAGLVMADRTLKEQQRMQEERKAQITEVQNRLTADPRINVGTEGSPVNLVVQSFNDAGVRYVAQDGSIGNLSWEQVADSIGTPIRVKTDAQIAREEADALVAAAAERRAKRAKRDEVGATERSSAVDDTENAAADANEAERHIPMNEDGTVNEAAFWEQSPEEYVKWNDEQNQDGGQDSLQQVAIAKQELMGLLQEANAAQNTSNPTTRKAAKKEVERLADRIARLDAIEQSYMQSLEEEKAAVQQTAATPTASMSEEDLESMDAQYQGILGKTRVQSERVRVMQEYLDKLSEGSVPVVLLTRQNYEEKLKEGGLPIFIINKVKQQVDAGKPVAGFMARGKVYLMEDGLSSIEEARVTYVHERQHTFNSSNPQLVQRVANALGNEESALAILKSFVKGKGIDSYKDDDLNALADEIICRSMEVAYTTEDFSVDLQSRGIPSEVISIIAEIDNEQRQDQSLSHARRRSRRNSHADVSGAGSVREDGRDFRQVSEGVLEQEETRPSGASGRGAQIGEGGEGAEVISDDEEEAFRIVSEPEEEEPSSPFMAAAQQEGESIRFSIATEESLQEKIRKFAKTKDGKATGWTEDDIESIIAETESLIDAIHRSSTGNEFYDEFAYKEPTIRVDWRDGEAKPIVTWTRANIEYKYDMSADLLCINNEGLEEVLSSDKMVALMEMFVPEGKVKKGETPIKFTAEDYLELYNTLRDLGFVVPCKGCFDAAGRFKMLPSVAQKFAAEVNAVIDERNKDPKAFDEKLRAKKGDKTITGLPAKASTKSDAIAAGVAGDNLTEHVKWTQLMSADGQTKMLSDWGGIFRAWQRTGAGRPKDKLLPEPYYGDIVSSVSTIIGKYGEKTPSFRDTLVNQGTGLRRNSHSEFRPVLAIDEIQFMRDAFIRNLTVFKYMKELDDVRLFGKMGVKFNMSFFPEYVPGTKVAGLDKEGNYIASEESVGSREFPYQGEDGKRHYDGMKGWAEAQKYINKDVSLSSVIFSIPHLLKALTDVPTPSDMRGIWGSLIPFHSSGATTASLAMQGLGMARANGVGHGFIEAFTDYGKGITNFEAVQNDRFGEGWYIVSGKKAGENVEPGHKLEFANGNHYYNRALGIHLFASGYILDSELPEGVLGEKGELNITDEQKKALLHKFTIDYNDKVRDIKGPHAYKAAADYYIAELPKLGLIPRFDFEVSEEKFLEMCEAANVDPRHPKLGWKGEGNSWSPIDSEAYYSLFCDYGMTDPATGEWAPHMPVGYVNEKGEREFRLPENAVEIVKDGLERFSEVRRSENARIDDAIRTFAERSVEKGRISKKDAEKVVGELRMRVSSEGPIDLVEEAKKAQAKHDAKAKKGKRSDVSFRITPEQDKAYMDAVEAGDMETAQRMVIEAARLAMPNTKVVDKYGNPKIVMHLSSDEFTKFGEGINTNVVHSLGFFTDELEGLKDYHDKFFPEGFAYKCFLNFENPEVVDFRGQPYWSYKDESTGEVLTTDLIAARTKREGKHDGLIMLNVGDELAGNIGDEINDFVPFIPSQIKSAEPITYDNNGNAIPLSERFNPENEDIRFRFTPRTDEQREQLFDKAKAHYGLTNNFNASGYMLPDGSLLDFSEANDGGDPNRRSLDHRDIEGIIMDEGREYDSRYHYVVDFVNEGAIRMLPEYAGFQLSQAPTAEQRSKLMDYIYKFNGEVILEITDENGSPKVYMEYNKRTSPSRIFNDMDGYFNDGTIPGIPPIRFRVTEEQRDEVQFRVISDALYEEMDDMIESLVGASFFRRVESEFDLGKKVKNFAEFADLITIIKNNDNYISTGSSLLGFFSSHTDQHFPLLLSVDDKALRKQAEADLKEALSQIDDTYILFYIKEAWKAHKNGLAQAGLGVKPNATTKFNKAIDARIEEIRAGRVKGTSFNFKKQEVSLDEIDTLFKQLNTNEELAVLHDKVMDLAKRFGIKPQFAAIRGAAEGESLGDKVRYDYRAFNSPAISDERKANIITHELIHSVTSYAFYLDDYMPSALTPEMREAINILREVYYAIRRDSSFKDEYGASSVEEMVAELSNTAFREKLKEKSLYQRILDAILKLFGVVKEDSAYNAANEALTYIIENYDENAFNLYARQAARSQEYSKWYNSEDVRFRMSNENQAIFVSNAARAVEGIKQEKATPEQWLKMLEKAGGLKAGEDKWMGLSDWLKASDKKTLTKAEVLDFINENMIIIEEQHYSNEEVAASANKELNEKYPGWEEAFSMDWDGYMDEPYASIWDNETAVELYNNNHEDQIELDEDGEFENLDDESKVMDFGKELAEIFYRGNSDVRPIHGIRSDYQTRGLSDNHEIALTVPTIERWKADDAVHFGDAGDGRAIAWIRFGETKYRPAGIADEIAALDKTILEYEGETSDEEYKALVDKKHALLRASRAQKVLVIDEIQSNRHQEGRKRGYKDIRDIRAVKQRKAEIEAEIEALAGAVLEGDRKAKRQQDALFRELRELSMQRVRGEIPDAPFEKNWAELSMKRMLRYAAENGFDIIAWTTGDQQADRYDLSRDVIKISAYRPNAEGERIVSIYYRDEYNDYKTLTVDRDGKVIQGDYNGSALADVVGKEMALQIMNAEDVTEFEGDGLKIGGEGMRGFYDKMLPAFMRKYGKKWGVTVEDINLPNLGKSGYTMHSVPVTEEMKSSVMEGQVMFRTTTITPEVQEEMDAIHASAIVMGNFMKAPNGQPTNLTEEQWLMVRTKNFKNWFGDWENDPENASKVVDENGEPKVVYHGSGMTFTVFDKQKSDKNNELGAGFYFTDNPDVADLYTRSGFSDNEERYVRRAREIFNQKGSERGLANEYESVEYFDFAEDHLENYGFLDESVETDYEEAFEKAYDEMFSQKNVMPVFLNIRKPYMVEGVSPYNAKELARQEDVDGFIDNEFSSRHEFIRKHTENKNFSQYVAFYPSQIKSATDNTGAFSEGEGDIRFKVVTDPAKIEELENGPKIKVYRAMQLIDGKLYPPMSAKVDGQLREPIELGQWEEAEERPDLADNKGYFKLDKGNKKSLKARYNPYFHTSPTPLNDQFSSAQSRPELVTVEVEIPASELTSGYKAEKAKDGVGKMEWKAGVVQSKLSGTRTVILSRWDKPIRIVPDSEVADEIVKMFEGKDIVMPSNVVTPSLRAELEKRGVPFAETDNKGKPISEFGPIYEQFRGKPKEAVEFLMEKKTGEAVGALNHKDIGDISIVYGNEKAGLKKIAVKHPEVLDILQDILDDATIVQQSENRIKLESGRYFAVISKDYLGKPRAPWLLTSFEKKNSVPDNTMDTGETSKGSKQNDTATLQDTVSESKDSDNIDTSNELDENTSFRVTGTPTEDVVAEGVSLSPAQLASLAGDIFTALPEESRKKITDGLNGNILGLQEAILQIPTSLATKENWNDEDRQMAEVIAEQMTKAVGIEMTRPFSASEALWTLYNAVNKSTDLVSEASRALVRRNLGMGQSQSTLDSVQFRTSDSFESIDEIVNNGKQKVSDENSASAIELMTKLNSINATLAQIRSITAAQKEYDKATVKIVSDLANELLEKGALSDMTRNEIKRLLSAIKDAVGKKDLSVSVERLMDIMIANQLRHGRDRFKQILKIRDKRVDQRGIEVRGKLDVNGQQVMEALREGVGIDLERLEERISETLNKMFDASDIVKKNAENELAGYELAKLYLQNIKESEQEEKDFRKEIKDAKEVYDGGGMSQDAYREFVQSIYAAIRENRMQRVNDYANLFAEVTKMITESTAKASLLRDAEKARVEQIHHYANSDMQGMPSVQQGEVKKGIWNNTILRFLFKPLATFDQMLRSFAPKSRNGEGYLWNHFMGGWLRSSENEFKGIQAAHEQLDAKVRSMFAGVKRWSDLFSIEKKLPTMEVKFWDGEKMADFTLTQGNLLYIYMVNKMTDGKMKLRKMGITEEDVNNIARELDPRFIELADWIQDTFLPGLREKYNTLHEKMFGAPMAAIDNYFPIRVLANARTREVDLAVEESSARPSTITGSIIKRTKNSLALDILGSDAFDVVLEHIEQMEHWAAFAEFNRDLNTLLSYRKFRNRVQNMRGIYGAGTTVWNNFRSVAEIAAGVYKPAVKGDSLDKLITNIAKGVTGAKISFRVYTALKQFLSAPAFVSDASAAALIKSLANPYKAWTWAMKELPLFEKRWKSRQAGDSRLMETESDWKLWKNKIVELAGRYGMTPNAFVDALTVSIGARAIYETKRKEYVKLGYTQDQAEEKAKRDATVLFNESQQSNESAFLSAAQVDRTVASILITVFRNSSMGYQRMYVDALRNIKHMLKKGYKAESLEYMKKQMMRDGLTEDQAERAANRIYNKSFARSATRLATFGFLVQFAWNLGPYMAYLLMGDDDDEKKDMIKDAAVRGLVGGPVEGLAAGQAISGVLGDFAMSEEISDPMLKLPATSDMESIFRQLEVDPVRAVNDIFNLVIQSGIGVNPQTITDAVVAIIDGCNGDLETSKEAAFALMRILQTPQSQIEKLYMEEIDFTAEEALDMSVREFAERYAKYKVMRTAPLTKWMYSDEKEKELEDKYIKTFTKKASEMERTHGTEEAQEFFEYYDSEYEETAETLRDLKKQLKEAILDSDTEGEAKANEDLDNFLESEEFKRFEELLPHIKAYEAYRNALKTVDDPKMRSEFAEKMIQERNAAVEKLRGE